MGNGLPDRVAIEILHLFKQILIQTIIIRGFEKQLLFTFQ